MTRQTEGMHLFAAIYIRVSTGMQAAEGHSLDIQLEQCLQQAASIGIPDTSLQVFREAGASGEDMERPELTRLLDYAAQGQLSHVIVKHPDRLSRNMADKAIIVRALQRYAVQLVFVDVPDWDKSDEANLLFNIIGSIAEYELRQIRRRTLSGKLRAVRDGQMMPMGIHPYGYRYEAGRLHVVEEEAAFVRLIFRWYAYEQMSLRAIAARLDALGAPTKTRRNAKWSHATVQRIISNRMYTGRYFYNRRVTAKVKGRPLGQRRLRRVEGWHAKQDWIELSVPQIVEETLFQCAQLRRDRRKTNGKQQRHEHMLQGHIVCALCARRWHAAANRGTANHVERYYRRPPEREVDKTACPHRCPSIHALDLEMAVWRCLVVAFIEAHLSDATWHRKQSRHRMRLQEEVALFRRQMKQACVRAERLVNLYLEGDILHAEYERRAAEERARKENLSQQIAKRAALIEKTQADFKRRADAMQGMLLQSRENASLLPYKLRRRIVEQWIDEVQVDASGGCIRVQLKGAVSAIKFPSS